jgi:hypothetical protein
MHSTSSRRQLEHGEPEDTMSQRTLREWQTPHAAAARRFLDVSEFSEEFIFQLGRGVGLDVDVGS